MVVLYEGVHSIEVCSSENLDTKLSYSTQEHILEVRQSMVVFLSLFQDNPSDFSYFFDTSRRRTCYIAPERFEKSSKLIDEGDLNLSEDKRGELNPKMDIFSVGFVFSRQFL